MVMLTSGLGFGLTFGLLFGFAAGLTAGLTGGLMGGFTGAWGSLVLVVPLLAIRGLTPPRLMTFLREAHNRGVLRQAGGIYQFRHNRLQDQLANPINQGGAP